MGHCPLWLSSGHTRSHRTALRRARPEPRSPRLPGGRVARGPWGPSRKVAATGRPGGGSDRGGDRGAEHVEPRDEGQRCEEMGGVWA